MLNINHVSGGFHSRAHSYDAYDAKREHKVYWEVNGMQIKSGANETMLWIRCAMVAADWGEEDR